MSLIDANLEFSTNDNLSADGYSENVINLEAQLPTASDRQIGPVYLNAILSDGFTSLTSLTVTLRTSDTIDGTPDLSGSPILDIASFKQTENLDAPRILGSIQIPLNKCLKFLQVYYTIESPTGNGDLECWLGMEPINESLVTQAMTV